MSNLPVQSYGYHQSRNNQGSSSFAISSIPFLWCPVQLYAIYKYLTTLKIVWYQKLISIYFDNCRIKDHGKLCNRNSVKFGINL